VIISTYSVSLSLGKLTVDSVKIDKPDDINRALDCVY